jgi:DNA-binding HxlR family transcriptional regulator
VILHFLHFLDFNELQRETKIPRATLTLKLKELKKKKLIGNEAVCKNGKVVSDYFLTHDYDFFNFKLKRLWKIDGEIQDQDKKKTYLLLLLLYKAVFGST